MRYTFTLVIYTIRVPYSNCSAFMHAYLACGGKCVCHGGGSNAIGLFHEFVDDADVRLIGRLPSFSIFLIALPL